jgi:acetyltransferase
MSMVLPPGRSLPAISPRRASALPPPAHQRFARPARPAAAGARGEKVTLGNGRTLWLRPIRADDVDALQRCFTRLSSDEVRMRFLYHLRELPHSMARQLCQLEPDFEVANVLIDTTGGHAEMRGVGRIYIDRTTNQAEFAVLVEKAWTGYGLGALLMQRLVDACRERKVAQLWGYVLTDNRPMLDLCQRLGFERKAMDGDPGTAQLALDLDGMGG